MTVPTIEPPKPEPPAWTPPASQADLDRIIADRLGRERAKFAAYDSLKAKATEYDKGIEASKSEAQKLADRATAAEAEAATLRQEKEVAKWAADIAKAAGVPADALRGSTQEDLQAHADQLKALIAPEAKPAAPKGLIGPYVPMEGTTPGTPIQSPGDIFAAFLQAQQG